MYRVLSCTRANLLAFGSFRSVVRCYFGVRRFTKLQGCDVDEFRRLLPTAGSVLSSSEGDVLERYNQDWMGIFKGNSGLVLRPSCTAEVSSIMKYCNERGIPIVPQGGNTGLVGGSVPISDEVILSLERMNSILGFNESTGVLTCQAGCILENLDEWLRAKGHIMPLDLGSKGQCQIGGNLATNAGGIRFFRYGSLRGSVHGMEVVLADGSVVDAMSPLKKNNTGYDLKQLFIGSEGTLGVITACALSAPPLPRNVDVALLSVPSFQAVERTFVEARRDLKDILSAVEYLDDHAMALTLGELSQLQYPFDGDHDPQKGGFYVLLETHSSSPNSDAVHDQLLQYLSRMCEDGLATDAIVATSGSQRKDLWALRENITVALSQRGPVFKYDFSLDSVAHLDQMVAEIRQRCYAELGALADPADAQAAVQVVGYGHLGDGNLHLNVSTQRQRPQDREVVKAVLEPYVYEWVREAGGSVSAEHGLGQMKAKYAGYSQSESALALMRSLKATLDPNSILNPLKVLPSTSSTELDAEHLT